MASSLLLGQHDFPTSCSTDCGTQRGTVDAIATADSGAVHQVRQLPRTSGDSPEQPSRSSRPAAPPQPDPAPWDTDVNHTLGGQTIPVAPAAASTAQAEQAPETQVTVAVTAPATVPATGPVTAPATVPTPASDTHPGTVAPGRGYRDGLVDGIPEDPQRDYFNMLEATRHGMMVTEPPLPTAQILVTVPAISLLGATNEPAELSGHGPIPVTVARTLLANTDTFLRVLTDPIDNKPLPLSPDRYWVRDAERTVLRALANSCYFPNCSNPVLDTELDHVTAWEHGGRSTWANLRPVCARHHAMKHFKDDKDSHGHYRREEEPDRVSIKLRGWKPLVAADGTITWRSPSGRDHPAAAESGNPPAYPKSLCRYLREIMARAADGTNLHPEPPTPPRR